MFLSIKYKLILLFLVTSIVPMFLLGGFTYVETYKALGQSEQRRMEEEVQNITNSINIALEDTEGLTKNLSTTPSVVKLLSSYNQTGATEPNSFKEVDEALRKIYVEAGGIYDNMLVVGRDGRILVDSWNGKYIGQSIQNEKYFRRALNEQRFVISEVSNSTLSRTKVKLPVISMAYPVTEGDDHALGAVIITYDLNFFNRHIYKGSFGKSGFGYMFDLTGSVLYHPDIDRIMKPANIPVANEIVGQAKSNMAKYYKGNGESNIQNRTYLYYYQVVPKSKWIVTTFISKDELFAVANWLRSTALAIILITGIISILIATVLVRNINGSLKEMVGLIKKVELGDFSSRCTIDSGDEFEELGKAFNQMIAEKNSYIRRLVNTAEQADGISGELNQLVEKIKCDVDLISDVTQQVSAGAETNNDSIHDLKIAMEQMVVEVKSIRTASEKAVIVSGNAVKSAFNGEEAVAEAVESMKDIEKSTFESSQSLKELYKAIDSIMSFVEIIKTIAAETNMLALNAAIQASHAGEHGLSFGVVAERIKVLAEESDTAAKRINTIIKNVTTRESNLLRDMTMVDDYVKAGLQRADRTVNSLQSIVTEVNQNQDIIGEILSSLEEQLTSIEEIAVNMDKISYITAETSKGTGFIADSINHEAGILGQITVTSRTLKASAQELFGIVSTFKLLEN
ncbi:MAG: methyl-accepting chemotaxis protein [Eubacteriales bacterium]